MASYLDALRLGAVNRQTVFVVGLVMLMISVDQLWYKPMKTEELMRQEQFQRQCWERAVQLARKGEAAKEHRLGGQLDGCRFNTTLG